MAPNYVCGGKSCFSEMKWRDCKFFLLKQWKSLSIASRFLSDFFGVLRTESLDSEGLIFFGLAIVFFQTVGFS